MYGYTHDKDSYLRRLRRIVITDDFGQRVR